MVPIMTFGKLGDGVDRLVIAVDAMGGDYAPTETVKGVVDAVKTLPVKVLLVGIEEAVNRELDKYQYDKDSIEVIPASEVITTEESPTEAIRKKKDSSMVVGLQLVKEKKALAFVSAGSTGALLTGALFIIGRIKGVQRPVLGTCLPTQKGFTFLVDSGANVDCKANYLEQFAKMGSVYIENMYGVKSPTVGLVNIGAEREKGNALTKEAFELLENAGLHFIGNIEPRDIPFGDADIVVCDGFVGNTILKFAEGLSTALLGIIKEEITTGYYKLPALALKSRFQNIKTRFDPDEIGGAPFLGLKALVVKAHGSSKAKAITNAVKQCVVFSQEDIIKKIDEKIQ